MTFEDVKSHFGIVVAEKSSHKLEEASDVGQELPEFVFGAILKFAFQQQGTFGSAISVRKKVNGNKKIKEFKISSSESDMTYRELKLNE